MSLAGPMSNLVLAIVLGVILAASPVSREGFWPGLAFLAFLQVSALVLNLIPLPPFDGFGVLEPFLPEGIRKSVAQVQRPDPVGCLLPAVVRAPGIQHLLGRRSSA